MSEEQEQNNEINLIIEDDFEEDETESLYLQEIEHQNQISKGIILKKEEEKREKFDSAEQFIKKNKENKGNKEEEENNKGN